MFDRWFDSYRWACCILVGLLLVAGFAPFSCATCGWIALVPAWWVLTRSARVRRNPMRYGYLIGLIYFGGIFWWISNVTAVGTIFLVFYLALYPAFWFLFVTRLLPRPENQSPVSIMFHALGASALWVLLEWWRSWFLTGFNWNELGVSQATSIIYRQMAAFGGVPLVSFVLVTVNILWAEGVLGIAETARARRVVRPSAPFACALFIVAVAFALGWMRVHRHSIEVSDRKLTVACIQPNLPPSPFDRSQQPSDREVLDRTQQLTLAAIKASVPPDLLVWPEAMIDQGYLQDRELTEAVRDIGNVYGGYFLLGSQDADLASGKLYNVATFLTPHGDQFEEYRKTHLVVYGEYVPYGDTFHWLRDLVGIHIDFTPGPGPKVFAMQNPPATLAPLICFEDTLPEVADKTIPLQPDFFVTITNDGWYTGWTAKWGVRQHLAQSIFRCIEHDRPMVRCANTGISCLIDENGTVSSRFTSASGSDIDVGGVFAGTLTLHVIHRTLYERWGDWIVLISAFVSVMLGIRLFCRAR